MKPQIPWLRVFVEGVVIVGSILLAFGLQAWWEGRQERQEERHGLELLLSDLTADTSQIGVVERTAGRYYEAAAWLLSHWDDPAIDLDQLYGTAGEFLQWQYAQPQTAGYLSLRDANRLSLIENDDLRASTVRYFEEAQVVLGQRTDRLFSEREALIDVLSLHFRLWTERASYDAPLVTNVRLISPWHDAQGDGRVFNRISQVRSASAPTERLARDARETNDRLRALITAELEARW